MHNLKPIREHLGVTQQVLADGIDCTQGNIGHYERGQDFPPDRARLLIEFAKHRGFDLTFDHIYGSAELVAPKRRTRSEAKEGV